VGLSPRIDSTYFGALLPPRESLEAFGLTVSDGYRDIKPTTPIRILRRDLSSADLKRAFNIEVVAPLLGMAPSYIRRAVGTRSDALTLAALIQLLDHDAFSETFVPRSDIPSFLLARSPFPDETLSFSMAHQLFCGSARDLLSRFPAKSIQCVVTSPPYWGTRLYPDHIDVTWADGETCAFGHEQTPEGYIRHTIEILVHLKNVLRDEGSIWWNLMDTYNTRTQIRGNAAETLNAMRGNDYRGWGDHECRRYSAGHAFLKDGEQCMIPQRVAERASRIGLWVKSIVTWKKTGSMPEPVASRVTRELEYIIHLSVRRTPYFNKEAYLSLPAEMGGRNLGYEAEKLTDVWALSTASGQDGHGAQFPLALPCRCIALTTEPGDRVLDPFVGSGTTSLAAKALDRTSVAIDVSEKYINLTQGRLKMSSTQLELA
jgi:DNA modification methylase